MEQIDGKGQLIAFHEAACGLLQLQEVEAQNLLKTGKFDGNIFKNNCSHPKTTFYQNNRYYNQIQIWLALSFIKNMESSKKMAHKNNQSPKFFKKKIWIMIQFFLNFPLYSLWWTSKIFYSHFWQISLYFIHFLSNFSFSNMSTELEQRLPIHTVRTFQAKVIKNGQYPTSYCVLKINARKFFFHLKAFTQCNSSLHVLNFLLSTFLWLAHLLYIQPILLL